MDTESEALRKSRLAMALRASLRRDGLPDWASEGEAPPQPREPEKPAAPPPPPEPVVEARVEAPSEATPVGEEIAPAGETLTPNQRAMRRRMIEAGLVPLEPDEEPPPSTPSETYRVSTMRRDRSVSGGQEVGGWPSVAGPIVPEPGPGSPW
ncbi:MAG TPA: hypothetical protein VKA51_02025 [Rubrobacteraceae bacterium]|nr:hypothetical protein [Rubrobacteraceae bacterium]